MESHHKTDATLALATQSPQIDIKRMWYIWCWEDKRFKFQSGLVRGLHEEGGRGSDRSAFEKIRRFNFKADRSEDYMEKEGMDATDLMLIRYEDIISKRIGQTITWGKRTKTGSFFNTISICAFIIALVWVQYETCSGFYNTKIELCPAFCYSIHLYL